MNLKMDEKRKHQIIGFTVIIALAAIFLPAYLKQSAHGIDKKVTMAINLPNKPAKPKITEPDQKNVFKPIQVAQVDLTKEVQPAVKHEKTDITASSISSHRATQLAEQIKPSTPATNISKQKSKALKTAKSSIDHQNKSSSSVKPNVQRKTVQSKKTHYAVQLASFTVEKNASALVAKLRKQGFKANYDQFNNKKGSYYRVIVGESQKKQEAQNLKKQLAKSVKLDGFVIKTGVS